MNKICLLLLIVVLLSPSCTSKKKGTGSEIPYWLTDYQSIYTTNPADAARQWFKDAKFGMFIHLNLASLCENGKADYLLWKEGNAPDRLLDFVGIPKGTYKNSANKDSLLATKVGQRMAGDQVINEASFFVTDPDIGIDLKTRPDSYWPQEGVIYDIKTCQDVSPAGFERDLRKYAYDLQAAFYMHVLRLSGCKVKNFVFACVQKTFYFKSYRGTDIGTIQPNLIGPLLKSE